MDKILVTVAGPDRAGVVYSVAEALSKLNCNFVDMSRQLSPISFLPS